ncbi:MAG: hypothetical protein CSB13_08400 [Chloroflexi bacterium]|nr:MAG: hypothetical protein CSB13_08400 [Chloroflexota bacterium]
MAKNSKSFGFLSFWPAFLSFMPPHWLKKKKFYSPTCPHCHETITNIMIPLMDEYGEQLVVVGIDTSTEAGSYLFAEAIKYYETPENRRGVPTLIVEDTVLVSTMEIKNTFRGMIEAGLAVGGNSWPEFPGLAEVVVALTPTPGAVQTETPPPQESTVAPVETTETAVPTPTPTPEPVAAVSEPKNTTAQSLETIDTTSMENAAVAEPPADPVGFALGWIVLLTLLIILLFCLWQLGSHWQIVINTESTLDQNKSHTILFWLLIAVGLTVAGYLAYVESMQVTAICGPVGECNIVQGSPYARILGIPVAILGLLSYLTITGLWLLQRLENRRRFAVLALVGLTLFGTLFSIYLTSLELLVIGAVCMWCLSSAVVSGLLCLLVTTKVVKHLP